MFVCKQHKALLLSAPSKPKQFHLSSLARKRDTEPQMEFEECVPHKLHATWRCQPCSSCFLYFLGVGLQHSKTGRLPFLSLTQHLWQGTSFHPSPHSQIPLAGAFSLQGAVGLNIYSCYKTGIQIVKRHCPGPPIDHKRSRG